MQTEEQNFNTLFYGGELSDNLNKLSKKLLDKLGSVDREIFNIFTLQKWIITFYNRMNKEDFSTYCESHTSEQIANAFTTTFDKIRLEEMIAYFPMIIHKYKYNKYHFRNRTYIPDISQQILAVMNNRHYAGFDFPSPKHFYKRYSDDYHWNIYNFATEHLQKTGFKTFLADCKFELRRGYIEDYDDAVFKDTGLEKIVYSIMVQQNKIYLCDELPEEEYHEIFYFLERLNEETPLTLDFGVIAPDDYGLIIDLCQNSLGLDVPLKLFAHNDRALKTELYHHLRNSGNITINHYGHLIFNINRENLFDMLDYVYHEFDKKAIKAISNFNMSGFLYNNVRADVIWDRLVRYNLLADAFDFEMTEKNLKHLKRYFITDMMLKDALNSVSMQSSLNELKEFIINDFEMYKDFGTGNFYLDIFPYIKSLLEHHGEDYQLPKNGWRILDDYYHIFDRVFFTDYYEIFNRNEFSLNVVEKDIEDITYKLIERINQLYPNIKREMQD